MTASFDEFAILSRILSDAGPLDEDGLVRRIEDSGAADPDFLVDAALDEASCPTRQLLDDRWVWLPALLADRVFTHRVGAEEAAHDALATVPDLAPIVDLCEFAEYQRLHDGSPVHLVLDEFDDKLLLERGTTLEEIDPYGALVLPPGSLAGLGVTEGAVVGVRVTASGLTLERVHAPHHSADVGERLTASVDGNEPVFMREAVWTACAEDPLLFGEPDVPLSEIFVAHGLTHSEEWLAPEGFDFDSWRFDLQCQLLTGRYQISANEAVVVTSLVAVYHEMSILLAEQEPSPGQPNPLPQDAVRSDFAGYGDLVREFGSQLSNPVLAEALLQETLGLGGEPAPLGLLAETLEPQVARSARVAFRWLRAMAHERLGDIEAAEREFLAAESMDPSWPLPLLELARYASDRGDVERGLALLRRAGAPPEHPLIQILEQHRPTARRDVGRNDACWCGSGRKYKKCHLGREQLPLDDRVAWLYMKACHHAFASDWGVLFHGLDELRRDYTREASDSEVAQADPLPIDVTLFEGGAFADFLEFRGTLLPEDERLLAEQWQLVERSIFEVEEVQPGRSISLRDLRSGERHQIGDRAASRQLKPMQLVCCRVVPGGDAEHIFGGIEPVALHQRDELIALLDDEPDPSELVEFLSSRFAPPTLTNTEGDLLMLCEATVKPSDPARIAALLDSRYERIPNDDDDTLRWHEYVKTHGIQRIRATLVLDGETLRIETNSERRMDGAIATLESLDASMTVLGASRQPTHDVRQLAQLANHMPMPSQGTVDLDDPETATMVDELIRDYETKWLDEPIPALSGHTPRQAAEDPTRRADLITLLNDFPAPSGGMGMSSNRIRQALGLREDE